jgi:acyl-CoA reductase-like NAD-dependent aldehyde dehydrogenase
MSTLELARPRMLIGGDWLDALDGREYATVNPATEQQLALSPHASKEDMRRAIDAARKAFDEGPWPRMPLAERSRIIRQIADAMAAQNDALSAVVIAETGIAGRLGSQALATEMMYDYADHARTFSFDETIAPRDINGRLISSQVLRQPAGVCGLLPTWNLPIAIAVRKLGPALASGCTMVMKAPPQTPLALLKLAEIIAESDLPPGVFNLVTGDGIEASEELVTNSKVDLISFTGGLESGRRIMAAAAGTLKRVTLELGGKSANIILDGVDIDQVASMEAIQGCLNAGQTCSMLSRVLVPRGMADALVAKMSDTVRQLKIGDPTDPAVTVGPLIREERRTVVESYVASGVDQGATLVVGGSRPAGLDRGFFFEPTIFTDVRNDMKIAQEEIFGPVMSVIAYDSVQEAIRLANDSPFGLQANVACARVSEGLDVARQIRCGAVSINGAMDGTYAPRGGFKLSGLGRECGKWALDDYLEYQTLTWSS